MTDPLKTENCAVTLPASIARNCVETWQRPMKVLLEEQAELLEEGSAITARWMTRRQTAMEAAVKAVDTAFNSRNPVVITAAYSDWVTGIIDRLTDDLNDARGQSVRLAQICEKSVLAFFPRQTDNLISCGSAASKTSMEPTPA